MRVQDVFGGWSLLARKERSSVIWSVVFGLRHSEQRRTHAGNFNTQRENSTILMLFHFLHGFETLFSPRPLDAGVPKRVSQEGVEHDRLLEMIPQVPDVQAAWLLLVFCASTRAVAPEFTLKFAERHDEQVFKCPRKVLQIETLHLDIGSLELGNAQRTRDAAHWRSWADSLEMIGARHPVGW